MSRRVLRMSFEGLVDSLAIVVLFLMISWISFPSATESDEVEAARRPCGTTIMA